MNFNLNEAIQNWLNPDGYVMPNAGSGNAGNQILYSSVRIALCDALGETIDRAWFSILIKRCFKKPGLLMRTPTNDYGNETFDDYLGVAVASIIAGEKSIPRKILRYGLFHVGFYNNIGPFTIKAWLGRSVQVWALMVCAAFPWMRHLLKPLLWVIATFFTQLDLSDASGSQLAWMFLYGCKKLGYEFKPYAKSLLNFSGTSQSYYGMGHPFISALAIIRGRAQPEMVS